MRTQSQQTCFGITCRTVVKINEIKLVRGELQNVLTPFAFALTFADIFYYDSDVPSDPRTSQPVISQLVDYALTKQILS